MPRPHILVIGSSNTDLIVDVERIPRSGETLLGGRFRTSGGGKGANQAVAASRAGGHVTFVARIGRDAFGDQALASLARDGIDTSHITRDPKNPSGVALIFVGKDGENAIAVASGANGGLSVAEVKRAHRALPHADAFLMQLETPLPTVEAAARMANARGTRVILNPAPAQPLKDALLRNVSILTPNETEAELLTGIAIRGLPSAERAALKLRQRGVETAIVTLGSRGALLANQDGARLVKGFKVKAIDSTAAGDTFNGALVVALAEGRNLDDAVRFANAAAALSVTRLGAQPSAPTRRAIETFLSRY